MTEESKAQGISFLGEQDGIVEQDLKRRLASLFVETKIDIRRAYLIRIAYADNSIQKVALCLEGGGGKAKAIVESVGWLFRHVFNDSQSLDILFLTEAQVLEIGRIAEPFYSRSSPCP